MDQDTTRPGSKDRIHPPSISRGTYIFTLPYASGGTRRHGRFVARLNCIRRTTAAGRKAAGENGHKRGWRTGRWKKRWDSEAVAVTPGNWRNFAEGKLAAVIKSAPSPVLVEFPRPFSIVPVEATPLGGSSNAAAAARGSGQNYEALRARTDVPFLEKQSYQRAKNSSFNAALSCQPGPDKATDIRRARSIPTPLHVGKGDDPRVISVDLHLERRTF